MKLSRRATDQPVASTSSSSSTMPASSTSTSRTTTTTASSRARRAISRSWSPGSVTSPDAPRSNEERASEETPAEKGVAVIVGWLGAEERHLDKYAAWWRSSGWETRLIAFDASTTMSFAAAERAFNQHLSSLAARLAERATLGSSPRLAFHAFSNTGWIMYARFVELLAPLGIRAAGAVIDSAPHTAICTKVWAAGFVSATSPKLPPAAAAKTLRYRAARALFKLVWQGERKARFDALVKAEARLATFPQLYIYSANDHVIPASSVRAVVSSRRSKLGFDGTHGIGIHALELADSKHVQHLRSHPREYLAALEAFERTELLGRGDRYLSSGMAAVAAEAAAAAEAARRSSAEREEGEARARAAMEAAALVAAPASASSAVPVARPADASTRATATVTIVNGGGSGVVGGEKAGKATPNGASTTTSTSTSLTSSPSLAAALLARVGMLHRSLSAPKAAIEQITTSAAVWTSPFGAVSADAKVTFGAAESNNNVVDVTVTTSTAPSLSMARSRSLGALPACDLDAMLLAAGIVFPASEIEGI